MANPARAVILRAALRRKQQGIEPGQAGIRRQPLQQGSQRAGFQEHIRGKKKQKRTACRARSRVDGHAPVFSRRRRQAIKAGQGSPAQQAFSHGPHRTFQARRATAEHRRFSGPGLNQTLQTGNGRLLSPADQDYRQGGRTGRLCGQNGAHAGMVRQGRTQCNARPGKEGAAPPRSWGLAEPGKVC